MRESVIVTYAIKIDERNQVEMFKTSLSIFTIVEAHLTNYPTYLPTFLPTYLPTYIPTNLHSYLPTNLHSYLPTNLHSYLPTKVPNNYPTYILPTYLKATDELFNDIVFTAKPKIIPT